MQSDWNLMFVSPISVAIAVIVPGHLIGCGGADPHNSLTSTSSTSLEHFPHKTEKKCMTLVIKQLLSILTNIKAEEVGYIEAVFLLNINDLQVFHASFGDEPGH